MNTYGSTSNAHNLTGQVVVQDYSTEFLGNYSLAIRGLVHGQLVAVKIIKASGELHSTHRKLSREISIWASLDHPNILPFYGFANDTKFGPFDSPFGGLISPWYNNGDASRFLSERGESFPLVDRIKLWKGIIDGVVYLHGQTPMIVHGDLKPGNVLIDDDGQPKICDFGLAQIFFDDSGSGLTTTTEHTGTERYLAPELVTGDIDVRPTTASDVYALGCLGLESIYLQKPYSHRKNNLRGVIFTDIRKGVPPAPELPESLPQISVLLKMCWNLQPNLRPSAIAVARILESSPATLPLEIITQIIVHAAEITPDMDWTTPIWRDNVRLIPWQERLRLLRHLCLVSRSFRFLAVPVLYEDIRIYTADWDVTTVNLLIGTLAMNSASTPLGERTYASCTKFLLFMHEFSGSTSAASFPFHALYTLVQKLLSLESIKVHGNLMDSIVEDPYSLVMKPGVSPVLPLLTRAVQFGGIKTLTIIDVLSKLSDSFRLQELRIFSQDIYSQDIVQHSSLPNLERLAIHGPGPSTLLRTLSQWELPQLKYFHLSCSSVSPILHAEVNRFFRSHGDSLHHIICDSPPEGVSELGFVLPWCPNLQTISFPIPLVPMTMLHSSYSQLTSITLLYIRIPTDPYGSAALFFFRELETLQLRLRESQSRCREVIVLVRSIGGTLEWAAWLRVMRGAIFEWDGEVNADNELMWNQVFGRTLNRRETLSPDTRVNRFRHWLSTASRDSVLQTKES